MVEVLSVPDEHYQYSALLRFRLVESYSFFLFDCFFFFEAKLLDGQEEDDE